QKGTAPGGEADDLGVGHDGDDLQERGEGGTEHAQGEGGVELVRDDEHGGGAIGVGEGGIEQAGADRRVAIGVLRDDIGGGAEADGAEGGGLAGVGGAVGG